MATIATSNQRREFNRVSRFISLVTDAFPCNQGFSASLLALSPWLPKLQRTHARAPVVLQDISRPTKRAPNKAGARPIGLKEEESLISSMLLEHVSLAAITERIEARAIHPHGVAALTKKMQLLGFLPQFPILVSRKADGTYRLLDGAHRVESARQAGLTEAPALIRAPCANLLEEVAVARASNEASGTNVQTTLVDDAELVWRLRAQKFELADIAKAMGWERVKNPEDPAITKVANYLSLQRICPAAWQLLFTAFVRQEESEGQGAVKQGSTVVKLDITERLLRPIVDLTPVQQEQLCIALTNGSFNKSKFTSTALAYKARNSAQAWLGSQLGLMDDAFRDEGSQAIATGNYDAEWQQLGGPGPKLKRLLESLRERWEKKYSIRLIQGDFYTLIKDVGDNSIDAILVDPPYNISTDRVYTLATQPDWHKDFGEWDNKTDAAFIQDIAIWAREYFRVMKPGTTGFMFVGEPFLNIAQAVFAGAGFEIKGTFVWCRTNPGPSVTKADFMPAIDLAIQFVKPGASRTFHYPGDEDGAGFNWQRFPICSGHERLLDAKKQTLHPTQKPEAVIWHLMELITVPGDVVFDGFLGTGTTAKVAKAHNRKFLGFEEDATYFAAAQRRVEG